MRRKHSLKELRLRCKNSHHAFLGPSPILHRKQRTRHQNRPPPQSRMSRFVLREVFMSDRFGQRLSLQKGQAHAFTGNGIDSSGRVANQRGVSACHSRQNKIPSHRSALGCRRLAVHKSRGDIGKKRQRITEPQFRISRKHHDANFVRGNGSYLQLRFFSPMDFDAIRPRRASKMLPKRKTHARRFSRFKSRPVAYQRTQSVRANNPVRREIPAAGADEILSNSSHHCSPQNHGARIFRRAYQLAMQFDSPHTEAREPAKFRLRHRLAPYETYSTKHSAGRPIQRHPEPLQRYEPLRQNSFAARFIARRVSTVGNGHAQSLVAQRNRRNKACGTSTNYKRVF